jgi:hypothetical protein
MHASVRWFSPGGRRSSDACLILLVDNDESGGGSRLEGSIIPN